VEIFDFRGAARNNGWGAERQPAVVVVVLDEEKSTEPHVTY
jgi:hypothetical protein